MQQRDDFNFGKPFNDPQKGNPNPTLASQQPRRWSLTTLMAARPNSNHDTRAKAEAWNREYADLGRDIPQLLVNPANFPVSHLEPTPEQVERNWDRLKQLSEDF